MSIGQILRACFEGDVQLLQSRFSTDASTLQQAGEITANSGEIRVRTPLGAACDGGQSAAVLLLLELKADCTQLFGRRHTLTALYLGSQEGHVEVVQTLLRLRAEASP